jgi:putative protease
MAKTKKGKKAASKLKKKLKAAKPAPRKKPARKVVGKRLAAKPVPKRKVSKKPAAKPVASQPSPTPVPPPGERVGVVTHYFSHLSVAVVKLDPGTTLRVGDKIHIKGHTSDFAQRVDSLQVGHAAVEQVGPDDDFGLKVVHHAREHDVVYRVK